MAARDSTSTNPAENTGSIEILELIKINPLIDYDRSTEHVESVLNLVSFLMLEATDGSITLDYDQAHGLAFMLETCQAALKIMRNADEVTA